MEKTGQHEFQGVAQGTGWQWSHSEQKLGGPWRESSPSQSGGSGTWVMRWSGAHSNVSEQVKRGPDDLQEDESGTPGKRSTSPTSQS